MLLWFLFHVSYWRSHIGGGFLRLNVRCVGIQDIKVFEPDSWFTVRCLYPVVTTLVNDADGAYGRSAEDNQIILWSVDMQCLPLFFFLHFPLKTNIFIQLFWILCRWKLLMKHEPPRLVVQWEVFAVPAGTDSNPVKVVKSDSFSFTTKHSAICVKNHGSTEMSI